MAQYSRKRKLPTIRTSLESVSQAAVDVVADDSPCLDTGTSTEAYTQCSPVKTRIVEIQTEHHFVRDKCVQVGSETSDLLAAKLEIKSLKREIKSLKCKVLSCKEIEQLKNFSIAYVEGNDNKCRFYTGLTWKQFLCLWRFLGPSTENLKYYRGEKGRKQNQNQSELSPMKKTGRGRPCLLSHKDQLLLTLMRLRHGLLNTDLAYRFGVSESVVTITVTTWIQFLYLQFGRLRNDMFPPRQHIKSMLPACFRRYRNIRTIIDCTEFRVQTASNFEQQGNLYSSYKSHTTFKVLVGISPNGAITYVSDAYEGSISDKDIVVQSGFLDRLHPGDMVMADRGFLIREVLNERKVDLNIPPFLNGRKKFTPQEEAQTKQIAKVRIHVERAIERLKKFRLLQKVIPLSLVPVFSQIVFVCACLVNFQEPIVK